MLIPPAVGSAAGDQTILELFGLGKTFGVTQSSHRGHCVLKCHTYTVLGHFQGWRPHPCPEQTVPMPGSPFCEEIFLKTQFKPSLVQPEARGPALLRAQPISRWKELVGWERLQTS